MEKFDKHTEQQIWQRVTGSAPPPQRMDLRALQQSAQEAETAYRHLAGQSNGPARELLRQLTSQLRQEVAMLSGLHLLSTDRPLTSPPQPGPRGNRLQVLLWCYRRTFRALGEYTARSVEAEYGPVFQVLAHRAQDQCAQIAQLLGQFSG